MDDLGDVLLKDAGALVKGEDVACGSGQCYTVSTTLSPDELGLSGPGAGAVAGLPIDLTGATVKVTVAVEKSLPYHLASVTAVLTTPDGNADHRGRDRLEVGSAGHGHGAVARSDQARLVGPAGARGGGHVDRLGTWPGEPARPTMTG